MPVEKKSVMWRNLSTWQIVRWRNSPHDILSCGKKFSTWKMWRKPEMWRNNVFNVWCFVAFYNILLQNHLFVIYAVWSRNQFSYDLRAFSWRKLSQKLCPLRKITNTTQKTQQSGQIIKVNKCQRIKNYSNPRGFHPFNSKWIKLSNPDLKP